MTSWIEDAMRVTLIGIGATAVMDLWALLLKRLGVPGLNMAFVGRWVGHLARGTWRHPAIGKADPVAHEALLGWLTHYAVGIAFAGLLVAAWGLDWTRSPSLIPALALGVGTVVAPWFVMQPGMGAGIASRRTPTPLRNALRSLVNHAVFGLGLYLSATAISHFTP